MKKGRYLFTALAAIAAMTGILIGTGQEAIEVSTCTVDTGDVLVYLELTGELEVRDTYTVTNTTGGRVEQVLVSEGDQVESGQTVLRLQTDAYRAQLESLRETRAAFSSQSTGADVQSQLKSALAIAQSASFELNSFNALAGQGQTAETSGTSITDTELVKSEAELDTLIESANCKTAMTGKVIRVNVHDGEVLAPGAPAIVIGDLSKLSVCAAVRENDFARISEGMPCTFTVDGEAGEYTSEITSIGAYAASNASYSGAGKQIAVYIAPEDVLDALPGRSVNVKLLTDSARQTVRIPVEALTADSTVFVVDEEGRLEERKIKTGLADYTYIAVISGIDEGECVVLNPAADLREGMRVRIVD